VGVEVRMRLLLLPAVVASTQRVAGEEDVVVIEGH